MGDELEPRVAAGRAPDVTDNPPASQLPEEDPFLGRVINGRVRIIRAIARGGMGKVYYGEQVTLSRPCAVKVLDKRLAGGEKSEFNKRFLLEASPFVVVGKRIRHAAEHSRNGIRRIVVHTCYFDHLLATLRMMLTLGQVCISPDNPVIAHCSARDRHTGS